MSHPTVSVIIPTRDRASLLARAVDSALPQCRPGDEVIVINDGSSDDTDTVLRRYGDRIRSFTLAGGGVSAARNFAIERAVGDLLAFLDDDDEWLDGKLYFQRSVMEAVPEVLLSFTNHSTLHQNGREARGCLWDVTPEFQRWLVETRPARPFSSLATLPHGESDFPVHIADQYACQLLSKHILPSSLMVRRTASGGVRFPEDLQFCEDWEYCARLSRDQPVAFLDRDFTRWHWHAGPRLTVGDEIVNSEASLRVIERVWGQDARFLECHHSLYHQALDSHRLTRTRAFLAQARPERAREELARVRGGVPLLYRLSARLPVSWLTVALRVRRGARRWAGRLGRRR